MIEARALAHEWRTVTLGSVVRNVNKNTREPGASGLDHVVGLDHLDSDSLPLRRWDVLGHLVDGTSFTRTFEAGQVLFGKRRAYQRKVAVPDFDGICSGDILVFEPSSPDLLSEFLPYLVQSQSFFDHALGTSAGSLSPRTKWQDLARYEFALPPLGEQERIVEVLVASARVIEALDRSLETLDRLVAVLITDHYKRCRETSQSRRISNLAALTMGRQKAAKFEKGVNPVPYLRVADLDNLELSFDHLPSMDFTQAEIEKYRLQPNDILVSEGDIVSPMNVGRPAMVRKVSGTYCYQNHLIRLRANDGVDPVFLMAMIEGARLSGVLAAAATTTTISCLGLRRLSSVALPTAAPSLQMRVRNELETLLDFRSALRRQRENAAAVQHAVHRRLVP